MNFEEYDEHPITENIKSYAQNDSSIIWDGDDTALKKNGRLLLWVNPQAASKSKRPLLTGYLHLPLSVLDFAYNYQRWVRIKGQVGLRMDLALWEWEGKKRNPCDPYYNGYAKYHWVDLLDPKLRAYYRMNRIKPEGVAWENPSKNLYRYGIQDT